MKDHKRQVKKEIIMYMNDKDAPGLGLGLLICMIVFVGSLALLEIVAGSNSRKKQINKEKIQQSEKCNSKSCPIPQPSRCE